jgi:hypothetical protein
MNMAVLQRIEMRKATKIYTTTTLQSSSTNKSERNFKEKHQHYARYRLVMG